MAATLVGETGAPLGIAITGIGGVGKSQVASEFCHRYGRFFAGGVFWVNCGDGTTARQDIAACGGVGGLELRPDYAGMPVEDQLRAVRAAWESDLPRLLVFDSCEDERLLDEIRPRSGGCRLLVTSRRGVWDAALGLNVVALESLDPETAGELVRHYCPDLRPDDSALIELVADLGGLPLALHLSGAYLARYRDAISLPNYLTELRKSPAIAHAALTEPRGISGTGSLHGVAAAFDLSWQRLLPESAVDALAAACLARASFMNPGVPFPRGLLALTVPGTMKEFIDAVGRLIELGLIEDDGRGGLRLHPLLSLFVSAKPGHEAARDAVERALLDAASGPLSRAELLAIAPHLHFAIGRFERDGGLAVRVAELAAAMGLVSRRLGDDKYAALADRAALAVRERIFGPSSAEVADSLMRLGADLAGYGESDEALALMQRSIAIQADLGIQEGAAQLNNIADLLAKRGHPDAGTWYQRALIAAERIHGPGSLSFALTLESRGIWAFREFRFDDARTDLERAVEVREQLRREPVPGEGGWGGLEYLGYLDLIGGRAGRAVGHFRRALAIARSELGADSPATAILLADVGVALMEDGDLFGANEALETAADMLDRKTGLSGSVELGPVLLSVALRLIKDADARAYGKKILELVLPAIESNEDKYRPLALARARAGLAELAVAEGDLQNAVAHLKRAEALIHRYPKEMPLRRWVRSQLVELAASGPAR